MLIPFAIPYYSLLLGTLFAVTGNVVVEAQTLQTPSVAVSVPAVVPRVIATSNLQWQDLTDTQRSILRPLSQTWNSLEGLHKRKWLAVTEGYAFRTEAEQKNIQSRMAEWAALPRTERERARLNFAETKKLSPAQRAAEWEAYQKLSPEEKKALTDKAINSKPVGAAVAARPVSSPKLTAVPITRHTPAQEKEALQGKLRLNPNTLLPAQPVQQPASTATVPAAEVVVQ